MDIPYDAFLLVSFGGPEASDQVLPFLENVVRGRNVPRARLLEVAEHYEHFGGVSPINQQNRELMRALAESFEAHEINLPIYWGNRNWHPFLQDTIEQMKDDGIRRAIAFATSGFSCYSGCRQYREDIANAQTAVGNSAPVIDKLRVFFNHPLFIGAMVDRVREAQRTITDGLPQRVLFTAHSIPMSMAEGAMYETQLREAGQLIANDCNVSSWELVYQSRSGPPHQPWLEPDILDRVRELHTANAGSEHLLVVPVGFASDHLEVLFDLDVEARDLCEELHVPMTRVPTVGTHAKFVEMIRQMVLERRNAEGPRTAVGNFPAAPDVCPADCCPRPQRPGRPAHSRPDPAPTD